MTRLIVAVEVVCRACPAAWIPPAMKAHRPRHPAPTPKYILRYTTATTRAVLQRAPATTYAYENNATMNHTPAARDGLKK